MNTPQTDTNSQQAHTSWDTQSRATVKSMQHVKGPPSEHVPPLPRRPSRTPRVRWFVGVACLVALVLIVSIAAVVLPQLTRQPAPQTTPTPTAQATTVPATPTGGDALPSPTPGVVLGPQNGPQALSAPAYWAHILGTPGTDGTVEHVSFANILGNATLQALVTVRHRGANSTLDVYVFDKITSAKPVQLFKMQGLVQGDAKISYYNTVLTAEVDKNAPINSGKASTQWTQDLFREFAWNAGEGTLTQVAFPGLFPDLTRYQAEADQEKVNQGQQVWKNDPAQVAKALAVQFLPWTRTLTATVLSGGGSHAMGATVKVQEQGLSGQSGGPSLTVTLSRLEGNTHNMWVAIAVTDGQALTIQNIQARSQIGNPVKIEGKGSAFEGVIGNAFVLDHLYTDSGHAQVTSTPGIGMGITSYATMVLYTTSFKQGVQEGIVEVQEANGGISDEPFSAVMVKVLLTPEPGVALGPLPGPDAVQHPAYWVPVIGVDTTTASVGTPSFANMKGHPSLQALVTVYHTDGSQLVDLYVYDQITSTHPVQLFKVLGLFHGGAIISGYSTILTAQVDPNSSVNRGKSGDQVTADLYREFKWSDGAGIFVQTVFPGIYPDLTRYQAEMDQYTVNAGEDAWKNNAVQVAQRMAGQLLHWPATAQTSTVSGGGSQDVDAVVQVKSPNPGALSIQVTLSRLEGKTSNIWLVVSVTSGDGVLSINTPVKGDRLSSPTTITGTGYAFEGEVGQAFVLDHLYATIGQAMVMGTNGKTAYRATVAYTASFLHGAQEGMVIVNRYSQADGSIATTVIQKVLLSA